MNAAIQQKWGGSVETFPPPEPQINFNNPVQTTIAEAVSKAASGKKKDPVAILNNAVKQINADIQNNSVASNPLNMEYVYAAPPKPPVQKDYSYLPPPIVNSDGTARAVLSNSGISSYFPYIIGAVVVIGFVWYMS